MDVKAIDIKSPKLLRVGLVAFFALAFNSACTVESGPLVAPAKESLKFQSHFGISASEQTMQQARTLYHWKKKFGGMNVSEARRLKALEAENAKLKRIVADQALDIVMLKDVNSKKW